VVLCPPFGREYTQAHFALRLVAEKVAAAGLLALRFDYDGTGDSFGGVDTPGQVTGWLRSIDDAIAMVRDCGASDVSLVGMRLGALLAAKAAAEDGAVDQLVLWDPCLSGRAFVRQQQALSQLTLGVTGRLADGSVETPGAVYSAETAKDLGAVTMAGLGTAARRVLVLSREDSPVDVEALAGVAAESLDEMTADGQGALMDVGPPFQRLPHVAIDRIAGWVTAGAGGPAVAVTAPRPAGRVVVGRGPAGRPITERPFFVPPSGLFGMVCEPAGPAGTTGPDRPDEPAPGGPVALFLSVANEHHIGPGRLWVDLSRRWAGLGIRCVRLDMSGLGESPVRADGQERFVARAMEAFADVEDAVAAFAPDDHRSVILVGLCSSAYQAVESALDLAPGAVVVVNPVLAFVPPEVQAGRPMDRRRKAAIPRKATTMALRDTASMSRLRAWFPGWRRRLRQWAQPGRPLAPVLQLGMSVGWRVRLRRQPGHPRRWLRALVAGGTDVYLLAGERDTRAIRFGTSQRFRDRLGRDGSFRFDYVPDIEHALLTDHDRRKASDLVTEHVIGHIRRQASAPGGPGRPGRGSTPLAGPGDDGRRDQPVGVG